MTRLTWDVLRELPRWPCPKCGGHMVSMNYGVCCVNNPEYPTGCGYYMFFTDFIDYMSELVPAVKGALSVCGDTQLEGAMTMYAGVGGLTVKDP